MHTNPSEGREEIHSLEKLKEPKEVYKSNNFQLATKITKSTSMVKTQI